MMYSRRFNPGAPVFAGLLAFVILFATGCTVDAGTAARSSLTSFFNTLATSAITSVLNQP
ncbi:MAG: hypothetical protein Q7R41_12625 [Phycisphaerales bacterium]|nr:hypothetical protein [Phycisphaerales bacterium]